MEDKGKLSFLKAMNKVQGLLEPVKKDSVNSHFKNTYASLAAVWEAIRGPLTENGFLILQGGAYAEGKNYLRTTLYHVDGHSESFNYPLIQSDNPQHIASATTYARRQSLCSLLGLSTEDDDGNAATAPAKSAAATVFPGARTVQADAPAQSSLWDVVFVPSVVTAKAGTKGDKAWTNYSVKLPDGGWASTFDDEQGAILSKGKATKRQVKLSLVKKGEYTNISAAVFADTVVDAEPVEVPF